MSSNWLFLKTRAATPASRCSRAAGEETKPGPAKSASAARTATRTAAERAIGRRSIEELQRGAAERSKGAVSFGELPRGLETKRL